MKLNFKQLLELFDHLSNLEAEADNLSANYAREKKSLNDQIRREKERKRQERETKKRQKEFNKPISIRELTEKIKVTLQEIHEEGV